MSTMPIQLANMTIAKAEVNGCESLSDKLTTNLSNTLDQAEDLGPLAALFVHVVGDESHDHLEPWPGSIPTKLVSKWEGLLRRIERANLTTFALVEGVCSPLALELLLVSDLRLGRQNFSVRHANKGESVWPGMSLYRMSRQIGEARTRQLCLRNTCVTATLAIELNLMDEIVDDSRAGLSRVAQFFAQGCLEDFAVRRRLMQDSLSTSFEEALGAHLAACDRSLRRIAASSRKNAVAGEGVLS